MYKTTPRTRPLRFSARFSAGKIARTTVHTGRGNSGCDSQNVCYHAPSHEMAANAPDTDSDEIPLLHKEKKEEEIQAYIVHPILQKRHIHGEYHKLVKEHPPKQVSSGETWAAFHENLKRTDWTHQSTFTSLTANNSHFESCSP